MSSVGATPSRLSSLLSHRRLIVGLLSAFGATAAVVILIRWLRSSPAHQKSSAPLYDERPMTTALRTRDSTSRMSTRHRNTPSVSFDRQVSSVDNTIMASAQQLSEAINQLNKKVQDAEKSSSGRSGDQLRQQLDRSRAIYSELMELLSSADVTDGRQSSASSNTQAYATAPSHFDSVPLGSRRGTLSVLSDDSFQSALEDLVPTLENDSDVFIRPPLDLPYTSLIMYHEGVQAANAGNVECRRSRAEFTKCDDEPEFLAKLYCVRKAMTTMLRDESKRMWMMETGRKLIGTLLRQAQKDATLFYEAYDRMIQYLKQPHVWDEATEEVNSRNVKEVNFYDIVLDFILMDAFDDLQQPPSAVFAVTRNAWLSDSLKESTLKTIIWSVLRGKRSRLAVQDGFISRFYDISEQVSPVLAWGFLGTNEHLRDLCHYFKEQISAFMVDIFSFKRVRYTSLADLSEDIWLYARAHIEAIDLRLTGELLPAEV